jgi:hypothetical protein
MISTRRPVDAHGRCARLGDRIAIVTKSTRPIARRLIALMAAYAIALQAMLAGFAVLALSAHAAPDVCATGHSPSGPLPMGSDCGACPALYGAPDAVAPNGFTLATPIVAAFAIDRRIAAVMSGPMQRLLPPSRAPPAL